MIRQNNSASQCESTENLLLPARIFLSNLFTTKKQPVTNFSSLVP